MDDIKALVKENEKQLMLFGVIVVALAAILLGVLVWKLPVISVSIIVLLEAGMAICLQNVQIWVHALTVIAQVILGAVFGVGLFLLVCAVFYVMSILALSFWDR